MGLLNETIQPSKNIKRTQFTSDPMADAIGGIGKAMVTDAMLRARQENMQRYQDKVRAEGNQREDARNAFLDKRHADEQATKAKLDQDKLAVDKNYKEGLLAEEKRSNQATEKYNNDLMQQGIYTGASTKDTSLSNNVDSYIKSLNGQIKSLMEFGGDQEEIDALREKVMYAQQNNQIPPPDLQTPAPGTTGTTGAVGSGPNPLERLQAIRAERMRRQQNQAAQAQHQAAPSQGQTGLPGLGQRPQMPGGPVNLNDLKNLMNYK